MLRLATQLVRQNSNRNNLLTTVRFLTAAAQPKQNAEPDLPNTSFMSNVFRGDVVPVQVFPYPEPTEDQKELIHDMIDPIHRFFRHEHNPIEAERNGCPDPDTVDAMWKMGLFGTVAPAEYGGLGASTTMYATLADAVGAVDLGLGVYIGAHQSIGWKAIQLYGSEEQKKKYLPRVTKGRTLAALALTEPSTGSDINSVKMRAVRSGCGKYYTLNGSKIWISGGNEAGIFTVFARTEVLDDKSGGIKDKITAFIVERDFEGVSSGPPEEKMGIVVSGTSSVFFDDVRVPVENVLGGEGNGFKVAVTTLNTGRFGMGGSMSGMMRTCIQKATEHATKRVQFGRKLIDFGNVQEKLARMAMYQYVTQSMVYMIVGNIDSSFKDYQLEAAISKVFSSESAFLVCDEAIQILGGNGYMKGSGLEKFLRDVRVFRIFEGANDVLRMFIALTGAKYAGSQLKELQRAVEKPAANLGLIFREGSRRVARTIGIQNGNDISEYVAGPLKVSAQRCTESVKMFGKTVQSCLIKHGKGIAEQQFILKRLADSAIDIYGMTSVLSRATRAIEIGLPSAEHEQLLAIAWSVEASDRVHSNLQQINSGHFSKYCDTLSRIARNVSDTGGVVQQLPLEPLQ
ncbi:very long-chain specific acyl-CoA dehydrogenase, mitochondrial-like [Topomyia yanbarensis]|uniref:very long-chain specific acyl-CoA dehydrogenase, mitochondrial-like n=1 Tax=Topomyia yanbarensis TaxID=2498891 RepID=UPI00273C11BE|nr:very long-chain specific acyl-CoA dehydrogenase, mitochondrial-like [Topomyia yanbarensis]XP_058815280.1 very long-chain specific acyl-CoA dehydrogenase, mitochondrial-like [Topomyia yanbarensis]